MKNCASTCSNMLPIHRTIVDAEINDEYVEKLSAVNKKMVRVELYLCQQLASFA